MTPRLVLRLLAVPLIVAYAARRLVVADYWDLLDDVNLAVHEAGHRRHGIEAAGAVERRLLALPPAEDCRRARRAAARVLAREVIRLQVRAYNYDLATGNGRTQGAVLQEHRVAPRPSGSRVRRRYAPEEPVHRPEPR